MSSITKQQKVVVNKLPEEYQVRIGKDWNQESERRANWKEWKNAFDVFYALILLSVLCLLIYIY